MDCEDGALVLLSKKEEECPTLLTSGSKCSLLPITTFHAPDLAFSLRCDHIYGSSLLLLLME